MGKPKRGKPTKKVREIESGDEISDSEPMDAIDEFHQEIDHESGNVHGKSVQLKSTCTYKLHVIEI